MEIKATDLRIGNWAQHQPHPDEQWQVTIELLSAIECGTLFVVGIPLTEELLLKMGAIKSELITTYNSFGIFGENGEIIEVRYYIIGDWQLRIEGTIIGYVKYIHQLQNVVFALFNEELTLS